MKKILLSVLVLSGLALSSCSFINIITSSNSSVPESSSVQPYSTTRKDPSYVPSTYENLVKNSVYYESAIPTSTAKSKYLVIPVWFSDSASLIKDGENKESIRNKLTTAFSGTTEETGWNSVKTYYETESNGKKSFDFTIADWYDCNISSSEFAGDQNDTRVAQETEALIKNAVNNYFYETDDNRKDYDSDGDGYIDAVAVIYAAQNYKSGFDYAGYYRKRPSASFTNFWAYVYWLQDPSVKNVNKPGTNAYLWASYDFANISGKNDPSYPIKVDAHAYIHETGHLFGLDDYYDYTGNNKPGGGFSMQDYNVGMHDPYSIISLGWGGDIKVPTETSTITLNKFTSSHDVILLSDNYQDSVFDEYLLLEYYSPEGLNELDSDYSYEGTYPKGPKTPGIRLWHVDARLAYKYGRGYDYDYSEDQITNKIDTNNYYNMLCRNNTYSPGERSDYFSPLANRKNYAKYRLLELVRNGDYLKMRGKNDLSAEDLFLEGDSFNMSTYRNWFVERGRLNKGTELGWSFSVDAITSESATITVTKL